MPLTNRVTPFGELIAVSSRGLLLGNRGGRFHDGDRKLAARHWATRRWICCRLSFHGRRRTVWGHGYTELFFLDEVTALAAGHRPCFECRRGDAIAFVTAWAAAFGQPLPPPASEVDRILHRERLDRGKQRRHRLALDGLPDGVMVARPDPRRDAAAVHGDWLRRWRPDGYVEATPRPRAIDVDALTPPSIIAVLANGYGPMWHPSAGDQPSRGAPL